MPEVFPFRAVRFNAGSADVSALVAPPYDVLDADAKGALTAKDARNIVAIDLPHVPAKELGPPDAYTGAGDRMRSLLDEGALSRLDEPAIFVYRQTFEFEGEQYQRTGAACCLETVPFGPREGGGVLPHEQTFGGPKEDRLALMKATACQTSPIFGLHPDEQGRATAVLNAVASSRAPDQTADLGDGVVHEVWTVTDADTVGAYRDALAGEDVFIADGHHRYNTALNYLESQGDVPADHPARRTMFVLVGMSDPGLAIGPTHRVLGGMKDYTIERFKEVAGGYLNFEAVDNDPHEFDRQIESLSEREGRGAFGVYDFATGLCYATWPASPDPLEDEFPAKTPEWRTLDVAVVQHLIVETICQPELNDGDAVKWAFPHSIDEVLELGKGRETGSSIQGGGRPQLAIIVRPTPMDAVRAISRAGELMPQKSTFFYPKLATGLFMNPLA